MAAHSDDDGCGTEQATRDNGHLLDRSTAEQGQQSGSSERCGEDHLEQLPRMIDGTGCLSTDLVSADDRHGRTPPRSAAAPEARLRVRFDLEQSHLSLMRRSNEKWNVILGR